MKNEYGVRLDRNGYAPSIIPGHGEYCCLLCGKNRYIERHEVFGGAYRAKSKAYGLWVHLCESCHRTGSDAVHSTGGAAVKERAQRAAMAAYGWTSSAAVSGKITWRWSEWADRKKKNQKSLDFLCTQVYNMRVHRKKVMVCRPVQADRKPKTRKTSS